jgi:hypothetical protein
VCGFFFFFERERERKGGRERETRLVSSKEEEGEKRERRERREERERERGEGELSATGMATEKRRWRRSMSSLVFHASACTANAQILFFSRRSPILNNNPLL